MIRCSNEQFSCSPTPRWKMLGPSEYLLVAHIKRRHEKYSSHQISGAYLAALYGAQSENGTPLPYLPEEIRDTVVSHLDSEAKKALTHVLMDRLRTPTRQSVLDKAARAYGFSVMPKEVVWETQLESLASTKSASADAVLAGLLTGKLRADEAVRRCYNNGELVMRAVEQQGWALRYAGEVLRNDREMVMHAVATDGSALAHASDALRNDREVVIRAVEQNGWALKYASDALRNDRKVVIRAVEQNGWALKYASDALRNDREVVTRAVEQAGSAMEYASGALRDDREIVTRAIKQDGCALEYASTALREDREVVMRAIETNGWAAKYASAALRADHEVVDPARLEWALSMW